MTGRPDRGSAPEPCAAATPATPQPSHGPLAVSTHTGLPPGSTNLLPAAARVPTLMSVSAAAGVLGCSPRSVRRRIALGLLPAVREQGRVKVRSDELLAYVEGLERHGPPPGTRRTRKRKYDYSFLVE